MTKKQFDRLSKKNKILTTLKDALLQIRAGKIEIISGSYCTFNGESIGGLLHNKTKKVELQDIIKTAECGGCLKGSLFITDVFKFDEFNVNRRSIIDDKEIAERLSFISKDQLDLMETAFECHVVVRGNPLLEDEEGGITTLARTAIGFGEHYDNDTDRAIAILENAIENGGEFNP